MTEYVPALYEEVEERVLVEPAHTKWIKGSFTPIQKTIGGDTYCLVEVPDRYETVTKKVLRIPAGFKERTINAVVQKYKEIGIVQPATTRVVKWHPPVYKEVTECITNEPGVYEWRSVLCSENADLETLEDIERALSDLGYLEDYAVDGEIDEETAEAIKAYQRESGLEIDGLINIETVESLNI